MEVHACAAEGPRDFAAESRDGIFLATSIQSYTFSRALCRARHNAPIAPDRQASTPAAPTGHVESSAPYCIDPRHLERALGITSYSGFRAADPPMLKPVYSPDLNFSRISDVCGFIAIIQPVYLDSIPIALAIFNSDSIRQEE